MTDSKKICPNCKKGYLKKKVRPQHLNIEGAPEFKVESFAVDVCTSCETEIMSLSDSSELNKLFLEQLIQYYSKKPWDVPGKAASWMRKVIDITARDLARLAKMEESTLSHTFKKSTTLDRFAATILLLKSRDFLNGDNDGDEVIKKLDDPDSFLQPQVPIDEIIRQIKETEPIFVEKNRGRSSSHRRIKKETSKIIFSPQLYSKYTAKPHKHKR